MLARRRPPAFFGRFERASRGPGPKPGIFVRGVSRTARGGHCATALPTGRRSRGSRSGCAAEHVLHGRLVDHTHNHGRDRRIWSEALGESAHLYVYLPPGFDPRKQYPMILWLHGMIDNEKVAAKRELLFFDHAMAKGQAPPAIVVIPDGSYHPQHHPDTPLFDDDFPCPAWWTRWDRGFPHDGHFVNGRAGRYSDFIVMDVLPFVERWYPIRPEREAHAVMGFSLSGWSAYSLALQYSDRFGVVAGVMPPLNMRWLDCHGDYRGDFDPCCQGWRTSLTKNETMGWVFGVRASFRRGSRAVFRMGAGGARAAQRGQPHRAARPLRHSARRAGDVGRLRQERPVQRRRPGGKLSPLRCQRGLKVTVDYRDCPSGTTRDDGDEFLPAEIQWVGKQLAPYSPNCCCP